MDEKKQANKAFGLGRGNSASSDDRKEETLEDLISGKMKGTTNKAKRIFTKWTTTSHWQNRDDNDKHLLVADEADPDGVQIKDKKVTFVDGVSADSKKKIAKKTRKGWKRIRHAALTACRYIGLGVSQLSPMMPYASPDYYGDVYNGYYPYDTSYNSCRAHAHWTTGIFLNGW